jgi:hypothetical protein
MAKKPRKPKQPAADPQWIDGVPAHLSADSRALFAEHIDRPNVGPGYCTLLIVALEALDRLSEAQEIIGREGTIYETSGGLKRIHPACRLERESRAQFLAAWKQLGLGNPPQPKRRF